ncbi:MAG: hypothetical protein ACP5PT_08635 [Brevinematia bacterium]
MRNKRDEWLRSDLDENGYVWLRRNLDKDENTSALEELAKIPQEIIDKENAQKYIEWKFFKSEVISFVIGIIVFIFVIVSYFSINTDPIDKYTLGKRHTDFSPLEILVILLFIIAFIYAAYDLYLRYKVIKRNKEKD